MPAMLRTVLIPLCAVLGIFFCVGCGERTNISAEESHLLERLTRDPNVEILAYSRDDDKFLVVSTRQGDAVAQYVFKPDVPGEKTLNIHRVSGDSALEVGPGNPPAPRRTH